MPGRTYLTTTLPYVNADPHIGFALELVQADIVARYKKLLGEEVFLNTGTDEHGVKIYTKAFEINEPVQDYVDRYASSFRSLPAKLGVIPEINFIRTTDEHHIKAAQEFWRRCDKAGDIYKKNYKTKYCVGCELERQDSELENGRCFLHPNLELEIIEEENYFFKFSKYQKPLLDLYTKQPDFVVPAGRFNEIKAFVAGGLEDFSISRLKSKMPWGINVPGDDDHVMYVWFDALVNYISAIGWPDDEGKFKSWWPVIQFAGKDNLRQQSAMWQAMLMSAGLAPSKQIMIHGFINVNGQKMSKSLGNVINPVEIVDEYGVDALRYFLARHINPFEDSDFTTERFKEAYNAGLANGLGNLVSRVMKMAEKSGSGARGQDLELFSQPLGQTNETQYLEEFQFNHAMDSIWARISKADGYIQTNQTFKLIGVNEVDAKVQIQTLLLELIHISIRLRAFMPDTAQKIQELVESGKSPKFPLFPRKD